ncbi:NAD(P)H-dependent oxidoreductase [Vibrio parahaemolyticus]|uniref:NAD(P)H-dependent oxidoreductase n=1 Tax=Vibrio parahaemolyticus TaxID=670 RepID=UPI00111CFAB7|nr:NAD(P)H-dependent oxidoreductase [Vibrio parahaemolyticus]TOP86014.1 NAD(P)H dehydrogenase [Vibrio parahaemolyticus]
MKTLVIVSHPYQSNSNTIKALEQVALNTPDVTVRNLESLYGNNVTGFDIAEEQAECELADRIIYLFPIHWFNLTPMLKAYLNEVWTYGWAFGPEGTALKGKEMLVVASAGATEKTYSAQGLIQSTIQEVLTPMKASARYVGMSYQEPIAFYEAMGASSEQMDSFKTKLMSVLNDK